MAERKKAAPESGKMFSEACTKKDCGFKTLPYGTKKAAEDALERHEAWEHSP